MAVPQVPRSLSLRSLLRSLVSDLTGDITINGTGPHTGSLIIDATAGPDDGDIYFAGPMNGDITIGDSCNGSIEAFRGNGRAQ